MELERMRRILAELMGYQHETGIGWVLRNNRGMIVMTIVNWNPDRDWFQVGMVIDAMQENGWRGMIRFGKIGVSVTWEHDDGRSYMLHGESIERVSMECAAYALESEATDD